MAVRSGSAIKWLVMMVFLFPAAIALSQSVPHLVNYQGRLTDALGQPISGSVEMRFDLLDADTVGAAILWGETQAAVQVDQGIYNVLLGSVNPLAPSVLTQPDLFLQVRVGGEALRPRSRLTSVPFAHMAERVANDAVTSAQIQDGSITGADIGDDQIGQTQIQDYYLLNYGDTVTGDFQCAADLYVDGSLGIGTSSPSGLLEVYSDKLIGNIALDQQQTSGSLFSAYPENDCWQSFTAGYSGWLEQVNLLYHNPIECNDKTLYIYAGEGTGGPLLSSQAIYVPNGDWWLAHQLPSPVAVSEGAKYTIRVVCGPCSFPGCNWVYSDSDVYPDGRSYKSASYDQAFQTYTAIYEAPHSAFKVTPNEGTVSHYRGSDFYMVPKGAIVMWSGSLASIPAGWQLCNGTNGTPDLRDRFIVGTSTGENPGATGGANQVALTVSQMPPHIHSYIRYRNVNADFWIGGLAVTNMTYAENPEVVNSTSSAGSGTPFDNRPAFYKLAFIMKL